MVGEPGAKDPGPSAPASAHRLEVQLLPRHALSGLDTNGNCAAVRRGGEQPTVVHQSVGERTRFGRVTSTSPLGDGEV